MRSSLAALLCRAAALAALTMTGDTRAEAQSADRPAWGRLSLFTTAAHLSGDETGSRSLGEFVGSIRYQSAQPLTGNGLEFGLDSRMAGYTAGRRDQRVSLYDAWVGSRLLDGAVRVRAGHMWLTDLGGLGAIAGGMAEYRRPVRSGNLRFGGFGGLEPKSYDTGYVSDVTRTGGYVAFDGAGLRKHVLGYVRVQNGSMIERSVLTTTNYVPVGGRIFVYQAAEADLQGPAGQDAARLTYFFTNARVAPTSRIDVQGTYHRGRSIDARTITLDQLSGRPISPRALEGLLYESAGGRVTVQVARGVRAFGGYARERGNRDEEIAHRVTAGAWSSSVLRSGIDLTASYSRIDRDAAGGYDSWYVSVGRSIGALVYLSGDFSSSAAIVRFTGPDGIVIENRPHTDRVSGSTVITISRAVSLLVTGEYSRERTLSEARLLAGITYRIQ